MAQDEISELLARLAAQDRAALRLLYDRTAPKLTGILVRMLGERSEAEDALQEVFLRIWTRAAAYDPDKGNGMTWMCAIARNHALDRLRARPTRRGVTLTSAEESLQIADPGMSAEAQAILRAKMEDVLRCFRELPEERARAVRGAYLEGLSYKDLSERLDVPLNTMRTWLRRALISLRECLDR